MKYDIWKLYRCYEAMLPAMDTNMLEWDEALSMIFHNIEIEISCWVEKNILTKHVEYAKYFEFDNFFSLGSIYYSEEYKLWYIHGWMIDFSDNILEEIDIQYSEKTKELLTM